MVITIGFLWAIVAGNILYAIADMALIRIINTQTIEDTRSAEEIAASIGVAKLKSYVGIRKWEILMESHKGSRLYEDLIYGDQDSGNGRKTPASGGDDAQ